MADAITVDTLQIEIGANSEQAASSVGRLANSMQKLRSAVGGSTVSGLAKTASGIKNIAKNIAIAPFKGAIKNITAFTSKISTLASSFKRILFYRAIRTIIKQIGDAFREGTQNLYYYSQAVGTQFAKSMDMAATSMLYFKNSIGAAVSPLVNALAPVLDMIVDKVVAVINAINQLIAKLTGATSWTRALKYPKAYGAAMSGAGKAAKEAARYLAPFDELNVLPDNKDTGGGGGGAASDYSKMFEEVTEFNEDIANFAAKIREAIQNSDWKGLGQIIGDKVNEMVDKVPWAKAGKFVGEKINAWFTTKYWTLDTINFTHIGESVATFLNNTLSNIDFEYVGRGFIQKFTKIGDFLIGALGATDWRTVGKTIGDYLRGILNEGAEWLASVNWVQVGNDLGDMLVKSIDGIDPVELAKSIGRLVWEAIKAVPDVIIGFWDSASDGIAEIIINKVFGGNYKPEKKMTTWWENLKKKVFGKEEKSQTPSVDDDVYQRVRDEFAMELNGKNVEIDVQANMTGAKDRIPKRDKIVGNNTAVLSSAKDNIAQSQKTTNGWTAALRGAKDGIVSKITSGWTANLNKAKDNITSKNTVGWTATLNSGKDAIKDKNSSNWTATLASAKDSIKNKDSSNWMAVLSKAKDKIESKTTSGWTADVKTAKDSISSKTTKDWTATVTKSTDKISSKITSGWTATLSEAKDSISSKTISGWTATLSEAKDSISSKTISGWTATLKAFSDGISKKTLSGFTAVATSFVDGMSYTPQIAVTAVATNIITKGGARLQTQADGGVYAGGRWHPINAYAGGGNPMGGELFIAREAGPELVGRMGNNTAVMNNDQIVASVSNGVAVANESVVEAILGMAAQIVSAIYDTNNNNGGFDAVARELSRWQRNQARANG